MRINKYLANEGLSTRREADALIKAGLVFVNGTRAELGAKINEGDRVTIKRTKAVEPYRYVAFYKPRGIVTHSPQKNEEDIKKLLQKTHPEIAKLPPIGRLDKESRGLIILTNDGRVTDRLLHPDREHDKEYAVSVRETLRDSFKKHMAGGVDIGDYVTKPCKVSVTGEHGFKITLTEGKRHQVRRMAEALHLTVTDLKRTRVLTVSLKNLAEGEYRELSGKERTDFLHALGLEDLKDA